MPSQVTMADSWWMKFRLFERHHSRSRIFESMENFQNDCCHCWTKTLFKKTRIQAKAFKNTNHSGLSPAGQFKWPKFIYLQTEATFETMMTTVNEINNNITNVSNKFIFRSVSVVCAAAETRYVNWFTFDVLKKLIIN